MKTKIVLGILLTSALMMLSCQKEAEMPQTGELLEITAVWAEGESGSRTALQEDGSSIWWMPEDEINVFYGSTASGRFTATITEPQATANFQGTLSMDMGPQTGAAFWAVYPYNEQNSCDGQSVIIAVSAEQTAVSGGFADKFFPAVATGKSTQLAFWNVCGGARFSVTERGIEKVTFTSADGSPICGKVQIRFGSNGKPYIASVVEGQASMTIYAPEGGFIPGTYYYATMLPQTHAQGLDLGLRRDGWAAETALPGSITVSRSVFGNLNGIDAGLTFLPTDDPIDFADSRVKTDCVAAFDTNGDGELSFAEAAAVTSLAGALTSKLYTSFDELRFFTSVTEIPDSWFKNRIRLKSLRFPEGLETIGTEAFSGCTALTALALPPEIELIGASAFAGCTAIESIGLGGKILSYTTLKSVFPDAYQVVKDIEILPSDEDYSFCNDVFSDCGNISEITLCHGLSSIGKAAFSGCNKLKTVNIPSLGMWLDLTLSDAGASPFYSSQEGHLFVDGKELKEILLPDGFRELGAYTFCNCSGICSISFPVSVKSIGDDAFVGCSALNRVDIFDISSWINIAFSNKGSAPFYSRSGNLYLNGDIVKAVEIPFGTSYINKYCFYNCGTIEEVSFPKSVKIIAEDVFAGCSSLSKVQVPDVITWLELEFHNRQSAPFNASSGGHILINGTEMTECLFDENVEQIGAWRFLNCRWVRHLLLEPIFPPSLADGALDGMNASIHVWEECLGFYKSAWSAFSNRIYGDLDNYPDIYDVDYVDYIDEYGVNYGSGILVNGIRWAPVNCGYEPENGSYKGYKYGKLYQWGRKNGLGFTAGSDATTPSFSNMWTGANGEETEGVFYKYGSGSSYSQDWIMNGNPGFWNSGTEDAPVKSNYDPCPQGWRVPTGKELESLLNGSISSYQKDGVKGEKLCGVPLPSAGCYNGNGTADTSRGSKGFYWSSLQGYSLYHSGFSKMQYYPMAAAMSVRCVAIVPEIN